MATIKIKELPIKTQKEITSEDIMVIEDSIDTKQISIEDLQIFFSADNKISALKELLENELKKVSDDLNDKITNLGDKDSDLKKRLEDLYEDHENTKRRLGDLIEKVVDIQKLLNATIERVEKNESDISDLQDYTLETRTDLDNAIKNIEKHEARLNDIDTKNNEQDERLTNNEKNISDLDKKVTDNIKRLDDTIGNNANTAKEYSDQLYDQIMKYIDYYHHYHEDPPNFDDPNAADTKQMNKIFKVGTVYETIEKDFVPENELPGKWKYVGETHVYDTNGDDILCKYTYVRTE